MFCSRDDVVLLPIPIQFPTQSEASFMIWATVIMEAPCGLPGGLSCPIFGPSAERVLRWPAFRGREQQFNLPHHNSISHTE